MRTKHICIIILLAITGVLQAQTYDNLWKQVEQAEIKDLPKTAIKLSEDIFQKGKRENNSAQMLKAYTWKTYYQEKLTPDSFYVNVKEAEQWAEQTTQPVERAILHSLIAQTYADYAAYNQRQLRQRTTIVGEEPADDMREWTDNMFIDKVLTNVRMALKDTELLAETSSSTYTPFVRQGETSGYYHHDMYHLLAFRSTNSLRKVESLDSDSVSLVKLEIAGIYEKMLSVYETKGNKEGYLLTSLDYLEWKRVEERDFPSLQIETGLQGFNSDKYVIALNELKDKFQSEEICAAVYLALVYHEMRQGNLVAALQLCDEAIQKYPKYNRISTLKNTRTRILSPFLRVNVDQITFPSEEVKLSVSHENLDGFTLSLYQNKKQISAKHYPLLRSGDYSRKDTFFLFKAPAIGKYTMRIVPDTRVEKDPEYEFYVTRLKVLTCRLPQNQCEAVVLDAQTGHPVSDALVTFYSNNDKQLLELNTDRNGRIIFSWISEMRYLKATKGNDRNMPKQHFYGGGFSYYKKEKGDEFSEEMTLLTDRSLYRPGQTVYVKGIAYTKKNDESAVIPNKEYTLVLEDVNSQEVAKKTVFTNEFGSFAADFALPTACLNGMFALKTEKGRTNIRVEEYKRPTFDITFEKQEGSYQLGDEVQVKGKVQSYSGVLLQNLPVKYTVERSTYDFWRFTESVQIASGEVMLNDEGEFVIPVRLEENEAYENNESAYYRYRIEAAVTNVAGETQTSVNSIGAGKHSLILQTDLKERVCKDGPIALTFKVQNLNEQPVEVTGDYRLYRSGNKKDKLSDKDLVLSGTFTSNKDMKLDWKSVSSGSYVLKSVVKDAQGKVIEIEDDIILFSVEDKRPPVNVPVWLYESNTQFDSNHPAVFYCGTSEKNAYIMMTVYSGEQLLESKHLILSDTIMRFEYPYKESYGDGALVKIWMVRDGEVYQQSVRMEKRLPDRTLAMKWEVFRDKLRPGQKEEWKLTIKKPQEQIADAEMLATMYDASLDKIWNRQQVFRLFYNRNIPFVYWATNYVEYNSYYFWWNNRMLKTAALGYDYFVKPPSEGLSLRTSRSAIADVRGVDDVSGEDIALLKREMAVFNSVAVESAEESAPESLAPPTADLRTNLAETAFFYPQLRTNEKGEVSFTFTMPESLTRWKFRGYAHTKDMYMGTLDGETVTSKEFMLTPNLPRFVRVGDKTTIAASIVNMTGGRQEGMADLVLFDPITEKVISTQKQQFSVEAGKTIGIEFKFAVSDKHNVLGCRIIADSGTFSDGEQQVIPVLSDKEQLTETLAMPIRGGGIRSFSLDSLFNRHSNTATNRKLTVEFTANPAWYAVQALPSLSSPTNDNAISWATAYYANALASHIMNSQPRLKAVFDSWKLQGGTKETFMSNLQKNQEVKSILLAESPWVIEAQTEEQQKERIATLFDLNNIRNNHITALTKLQELQNSTGAWTWYKGMNDSRYVTTYVMGLNARLALLTDTKPEGVELSMQKKAFTYLHQAALKEYKDILKRQKTGMKFNGISYDALQYLYLIAISGEQVPVENKAVYNYFLSKLPEMLSTTSMNTKATIAIILDKFGRKKEAQEFVSSLKEHLTRTDEQGMFFAFNENPYTWNGMKQRAHVNVMEALEMVGENSEFVEEMKFWLLKQKQTMQWNSPVANADAVYALFMKGANLLDSQDNICIKLAGEVLDTSSPAENAVPGLGYIKRTFTQKKVVDARKIEIEKKEPGIAWGAVYAQYESPLADVKQHGGELNVQKQLYVERMVNNAYQLQPIADKAILKVGDIVVSRLTIRIDRPMDFVQLKDQRGACFEPLGNVSGYCWNNGIGYYVDIKDASINVFFDHLGKGVYVLEHRYRVSRTGTYAAGLAVMQCAYAPEYTTHSSSMTVEVK